MDIPDYLNYIAERQKQSGAEKQKIQRWTYGELHILFNLRVFEAAIPAIICKSIIFGFGIVLWFVAYGPIEEYGGDSLYEYTIFAIATLILLALGYWLYRSISKWKRHEETWRRLLQKEIAKIIEVESYDSEADGQPVDEAYEKGYYAGAMDAKNEKLDKSLFPKGTI